MELSLTSFFLSLAILLLILLTFLHFIEAGNLFLFHILFLFTHHQLLLIAIFQAKHGLIFPQSLQLWFFIVDLRFANSLFAATLAEGEEWFSEFFVLGDADHEAVIVFASLFLEVGEERAESSLGGSALLNPILKESNCIFDNIFYISGFNFIMTILHYHRMTFPTD